MQVALDGAVYRLVRRGEGDFTVGAPIHDEMTLGRNLIRLSMLDDMRGLIVRDPSLASNQLLSFELRPAARRSVRSCS